MKNSLPVLHNSIKLIGAATKGQAYLIDISLELSVSSRMSSLSIPVDREARN